MADRTPVALSAMHHRHVAHGAVMVVSEGWQRPARYAGVEEEIEQVRQAVGLCDVSQVGKVKVQGQAVDSLLKAALPNMRPLPVGRLSQQKLSWESGAESVLLARLADDEVMVLTPPGRAPGVSEALSQVTEHCSHAVDITSALAGVMLAGPLAHQLLAGLTEVDTSPDAFPNMSCVQAMVAEIHGTLLRRDAGGLKSIELYFGREYGEYMWDALVEAGDQYGVSPFGDEAMMALVSGA